MNYMTVLFSLVYIPFTLLTISAHQKAVEFLHPATQQQKSDDPTAKTTQQQGQRIKIIYQDSCHCAKNCHNQKDKGAYTCAAVIRKIIEYDNGEIHTEHGVYPQAQNYKHIQHIGTGVQIREENADQTD